MGALPIDDSESDNKKSDIIINELMHCFSVKKAKKPKNKKGNNLPNLVLLKIDDSVIGKDGVINHMVLVYHGIPMLFT